MTKKQINRANSLMALAQLKREGLLFTRPHRDSAVSEDTWWPLESANEVERAAAEQARQTWLAEGCPEYGDNDLVLFIDKVVSS